MRRVSLYVFALLGIAALIGHTVVAENKAAPAASQAAQVGASSPVDPAKAEMMKRWEAVAAPGEEHKRLQPLVGTWKHTVTWWMEPNGQPEVSDGVTETHWVLGGRFLQSRAAGQAMGQAFEGLGYTGYDRLRKEYTGVWLDSMSTTMMASTSQYDPATKSFAEAGTFACPMTGETHRRFRGKLTITGDRSYTYEMWTTHTDGTEYKSMEIAYERR